MASGIKKKYTRQISSNLAQIYNNLQRELGLIYEDPSLVGDSGESVATPYKISRFKDFNLQHFLFCEKENVVDWNATFLAKL